MTKTVGLGMIVRADNRGLGIQTQTLHKYLKPEKTLVMDMGDATPYEQRFERFPDGTVMPFPLPNDEFKKWAKGLSWIVSCETFYSDEVPDIAREVGARTVLQFNLEFLRHVKEDICRPDVFVAPSTWHLEMVPFPVVLAHTPVDRSIFPYKQVKKARRFLHVVGRPARSDRAGTRILWAALKHIKSPLSLTIKAQEDLIYRATHNFDLEIINYVYKDVESNVDLYKDADVLIAPRRYGGQSLVLNEAASVGLPIVAINKPPENEFLDPRSMIRFKGKIKTSSQAGSIFLYSASPIHLAEKIDELFNDNSLVEMLSYRSNEYAKRLEWDNISPIWEAILDGRAEDVYYRSGSSNTG